MTPGSRQNAHHERPPSLQPDYLRRRVVWAVQAAKLGGLPKPISGKVMELKEHLPRAMAGSLRRRRQGPRHPGPSGRSALGDLTHEIVGRIGADVAAPRPWRWSREDAVAPCSIVVR